MTHMVDIDEFLPEALRYAPNTSDIVAQRAIVTAARQLCDTAALWRENDRFEITAPAMQGVSTIEDASIVSITNAKLNGVPLLPKTNAWLDENVPDWSLPDAPSGFARFVTQIEPNTVTIVPKATGTMDIRLVLKPARTASTLPAFLLEGYSEEIGRGAAAIILTDPASQNPQLGLDHRGWFKDRLTTIALAALKGQQGAALRTRPAYL